MNLFHALVILASVCYVYTQQFSCPPTYQPANACTAGPCRCAIFETLQIETTSYGADATVATLVRINVTNICDNTNPINYVRFNLCNLDQSQILQLPTALNPNTWTQHYTWAITTVNDFTGGSTPALNWVQFTPQGTAGASMTANTNGVFQWDILQFIVTGYIPTYDWYFQMSMGSNYDTFGPLDMSICECANCDSGWIQRIILPCTLGYPDTTTGRAPTNFDESTILYSFAITNNLLQLWYSDEHPMMLGLHNYVFPNGTNITAPFTPTYLVGGKAVPICLSAPDIQFGFNIFDSHNVYGNVDTGGSFATDTFTPTGTTVDGCTESLTQGCGRPLPPTLYITDITGDLNGSRAGDWQYGGQPYLPVKICGVWKGATKVITNMNTGSFTITVDPDPTPQNENPAGTGWFLGQDADPLPIGFVEAGATILNWGAEAAWDLDQLGLDSSSTYRFQFMVHDGDQSHNGAVVGGDVGEACIEATSACPPGFAGPKCQQCDLYPAPITHTYTWWCQPVTAGGYQLIKIPVDRETESFYSSGFVPGNTTVDPQGFNITCNCDRIIVPCPNQCCGNGICFQQNGTCACTPGPAGSYNTSTCCIIPPPPPPPYVPPPRPANDTEPIEPPPPPPPPALAPPVPCLNDGLYCSGEGHCNTTLDVCDCLSGFTGVACNVTIPPPAFTCEDIVASTCKQCADYSVSLGLTCVWCSNATNTSAVLVTGTCNEETVCPFNSSYASCPQVTNFVPALCPDACLNHGTCTNVTAANYQQALPSIEWYGKNISAFCLCYTGYSGINCGQVPAPQTQTAIIAGVSTAAIVGICIGLAVLAAGAGGGGAFAYGQAGGGGAAPTVGNNPLYEGKGFSANNPLAKM